MARPTVRSTTPRGLTLKFKPPLNALRVKPPLNTFRFKLRLGTNETSRVKQLACIKVWFKDLFHLASVSKGKLALYTLFPRFTRFPVAFSPPRRRGSRSRLQPRGGALPEGLGPSTPCFRSLLSTVTSKAGRAMHAASIGGTIVAATHPRVSHVWALPPRLRTLVQGTGSEGGCEGHAGVQGTFCIAWLPAPPKP